MQQVKQIAHVRNVGAVAIFVTVDGLSEQRDFFAALIGQDLGFVDDLLRWSPLLWPAGHRDDAVGAKLVAADLNSKIGLKWCRPHGWIAQRIERLVASFDFGNGSVSPPHAERHLVFFTGASPFN